MRDKPNGVIIIILVFRRKHTAVLPAAAGVQRDEHRVKYDELKSIAKRARRERSIKTYRTVNTFLSKVKIEFVTIIRIVVITFLSTRFLVVQRCIKLDCVRFFLIFDLLLLFSEQSIACICQIFIESLHTAILRVK